MNKTNSNLNLVSVFAELNKLYDVSKISARSIESALKDVANDNTIEYNSIDDMFDSVGW